MDRDRPWCVVARAPDGRTLLEAMKSLQPDVVIVDLFIPPNNGLEICREIKAVAPLTDVIIVSATNDRDITEEALRSGAAAFIPKFQAPDLLLPAIHKAMAARVARAALAS